MRLWRYWPKPRRAKIGLSSVIYAAARWGIKMNRWWLYERNFQRAQQINPFSRASRGYDARPPIRLTLNVIQQNWAFQTANPLNGISPLRRKSRAKFSWVTFGAFFGMGRLSSSPEANSLIVSVCQVSFGPFFFLLKLSSEPEAAEWKYLEPSSGVRINSTLVWMHALTSIGRRRKKGLIRCAGTRIRRWWQTGRWRSWIAGGWLYLFRLRVRGDGAVRVGRVVERRW